MELDYFREFIELSNGQSISQTAQNLHTSQSALSRHVQALEAEFGVALIARTNNATQFTAEGEVVYDLAQTLIREYDRVKLAFEKTEQNTHSLTISGHIDAPEDFLLFLNSSELLSNKSKGAVVHFLAPNSRNETAYRDELLAGTVDVVFLWGNVLRFFKDDSVFAHRSVLSRPWKAFVSTENPLSEKERLTLQDFSGQPVIHLVGERYTSSWRMVSRFFAKHDIPIEERIVRCSSLYDYLTTPLKDAILLFPPPPGTLLNRSREKSAILDICSDIPFELNMYAIYRKNHNSELIEEYLDVFEQAAKSSL